MRHFVGPENSPEIEKQAALFDVKNLINERVAGKTQELASAQGGDADDLKQSIGWLNEWKERIEQGDAGAALEYLSAEEDAALLSRQETFRARNAVLGKAHPSNRVLVAGKRAQLAQAGIYPAIRNNNVVFSTDKSPSSVAEDEYGRSLRRLEDVQRLIARLGGTPKDERGNSAKAA